MKHSGHILGTTYGCSYDGKRPTRGSTVMNATVASRIFLPSSSVGYCALECSCIP